MYIYKHLCVRKGRLDDIYVSSVLSLHLYIYYTWYRFMSIHHQHTYISMSTFAYISRGIYWHVPRSETRWTMRRSVTSSAMPARKRKGVGVLGTIIYIYIYMCIYIYAYMHSYTYTYTLPVSLSIYIYSPLCERERLSHMVTWYLDHETRVQNSGLTMWA